MNYKSFSKYEQKNLQKTHSRLWAEADGKYCSFGGGGWCTLPRICSLRKKLENKQTSTLQSLYPMKMFSA